MTAVPIWLIFGLLTYLSVLYSVTEFFSDFNFSILFINAKLILGEKFGKKTN